MRSAPTLNIWMTPFASVAILEKLALLKIALCRAPAVSRASSIAAESRLSLAMAHLRPENATSSGREIHGVWVHVIREFQYGPCSRPCRAAEREGPGCGNARDDVERGGATARRRSRPR